MDHSDLHFSKIFSLGNIHFPNTKMFSKHIYLIGTMHIYLVCVPLVKTLRARITRIIITMWREPLVSVTSDRLFRHIDKILYGILAPILASLFIHGPMHKLMHKFMHKGSIDGTIPKYYI